MYLAEMKRLSVFVRPVSYHVDVRGAAMCSTRKR